MTEPSNLAADLEILRNTQPAWRLDGLGVKGNAIEAHREQAQVHWPSAGLTRRDGRPISGPASAGQPEAPSSIPAS